SHQPSKKQGVRPLEFHQDERKWGFRQEFLAAEKAHRESVNFSLIRESYPFGFAPRIHIVPPRGRVGVTCCRVAAAQKNPVRETGEKGAVLPVAVEIIDRIVLLYDERSHTLKVSQFFRARIFWKGHVMDDLAAHFLFSPAR